jgi:hypothetical protein
VSANGNKPSFVPLSISPAEQGWRALYGRGGEHTSDEPWHYEWEVVPLVGWGVFSIDTEPSRNTIAGVVADRTYPDRVRYVICAEDPAASTRDFVGYLAPGMPVPSNTDAGVDRAAGA